MTLYRDRTTQYRDPTTPYRGKPEVVPGVDYNRTDGISIFLQDKNANRFGRQLNGANVRSVTWKLNDTPQAEFDFQNFDPTLKTALLLQRDIFVVFNKTINVDTGLPETFLGTLGRRKGKPGTHTIIADGFEQWLKERCVEVGSLEYDNVDQFDIAWGLIQTAQTGTNYDLGITSSYVPSGKLRYRIYDRVRHQYILDLLREFNKIDQGFDQDFIGDPITGHRKWVPYYPSKGSFKPLAHLVWGRNIIDYDYDENGWATKTKLIQKGASYAGINFEQIYEDIAASEKYGAMVGVATDSGQKDVDWLLAEAIKSVNVLKVPPLSLSVTVKDLPGDPAHNIPAVPIFGAVHTGDSVQVDIDDGANQVHGVFRIGTFKYMGPNKYQLTFLNPSATATI